MHLKVTHGRAHDISQEELISSSGKTDFTGSPMKVINQSTMLYILASYTMFNDHTLYEKKIILWKTSEPFIQSLVNQLFPLGDNRLFTKEISVGTVTTKKENTNDTLDTVIEFDRQIKEEYMLFYRVRSFLKLSCSVVIIIRIHTCKMCYNNCTS